MSTKKAAGGRANQGTPRKGKRLGVKLFSGELVKKGQIIVRQRGSTLHEGKGVNRGRDFTLFANKDGKVEYKILRSKKIVEVI